jgi:hypothetical protein
LPIVKKPGDFLECKQDILNLSIKNYSKTNQNQMKNVKVHVALGDLQCAIYSCLENEFDCGKLFLFICYFNEL